MSAACSEDTDTRRFTPCARRPAGARVDRPGVGTESVDDDDVPWLSTLTARTSYPPGHESRALAEPLDQRRVSSPCR